MMAEFIEMIVMLLLWKKLGIFREKVAVCSKLVLNFCILVFQIMLVIDYNIEKNGFVIEKEMMDLAMYVCILTIFANSTIFCVLSYVACISEIIEIENKANNQIKIN